MLGFGSVFGFVILVLVLFLWSLTIWFVRFRLHCLFVG